jgi:hypothetical protein
MLFVIILLPFRAIVIKRVTIQKNIAYHQGNSDKKTNNTIKIIYHQGPKGSYGI